MMKLRWGNSDPETNVFARTELVELLASEDSETRAEAMERLGIASEEEMLSFLTDCLTEYNEELRSAAARVLTDMGDESVLFGFIDALVDPDFHVRYGAERAILAFEDSRPLIRHMQHFLRNKGVEGERDKRVDAVEALGKLADERAIPFLLGALYDGERNVRVEAADVLGRMGDEPAVPALVHLVKWDWSDRVVFAAAEALVEIGGEKAFEGLTGNLRIREPLGWEAAIEALGMIGDRRAVPHILKALPCHSDSESWFVRETLNTLDDGNLFAGLLADLRGEDAHKRGCAALALGMLGDARAEEPLVEALRGSSGWEAKGRAGRYQRRQITRTPMCALPWRSPLTGWMLPHGTEAPEDLIAGCLNNSGDILRASHSPADERPPHARQRSWDRLASADPAKAVEEGRRHHRAACAPALEGDAALETSSSRLPGSRNDSAHLRLRLSSLRAPRQSSEHAVTNFASSRSWRVLRRWQLRHSQRRLSGVNALRIAAGS